MRFRRLAAHAQSPRPRDAARIGGVVALAIMVGTPTPARAQGTQAPGPSTCERLMIRTSAGPCELDVDVPDAVETTTHEKFIRARKVRARVIVRAQDQVSIRNACQILARTHPRLARLNIRPLGTRAGFCTIDCPSVRLASKLADHLTNQPGINEAYLDSAKPIATRSLPTDPGVASQWFFDNPAHPAATLNIQNAWMQNITGTGITVGIIDAGFNTAHPDLVNQYNATASQTPPEFGITFTNHGTSTAGLVAAQANNAEGGCGVAYGAQLARLYYGFESDNAAAFLYRNDLTSIKSNSWGPFDSGTIVGGVISSIELAALEEASTTGRSGLGEIFVWAAGNGAAIANDRTDYDQYASNRFSICVGAIDNQDRASVYSEPGSSLMLVTTSSYDTAGSSGSGIYTTTGPDGSCSYTTNASPCPTFGGTSAAAPIAAGVCALVLQANPNLSARDVAHVLINSARHVRPSDESWSLNGAAARDGGPRFISDQLGFGAIDASAAVALAQIFATLGPERSFTSPEKTANLPIPDSDFMGVSSIITIPAHMLVERAQVVLTAPHPRVGDLLIQLRSPSGTRSTLAAPRNDTSAGYNQWVFTSVKHVDELAKGNWTLTISDRTAGGDPQGSGTFQKWTLRLYGRDVPCAADWDRSGAVKVTDIFAFLADWFAGRADFNTSGTVTVTDIFAFLSAWFAGSC